MEVRPGSFLRLLDEDKSDAFHISMRKRGVVGALCLDCTKPNRPGWSMRGVGPGFDRGGALRLEGA
jgi:hypothetical protein